jgi:hypothetical protein
MADLDGQLVDHRVLDRHIRSYALRHQRLYADTPVPQATSTRCIRCDSSHYRRRRRCAEAVSAVSSARTAGRPELGGGGSRHSQVQGWRDRRVTTSRRTGRSERLPEVRTGPLAVASGQLSSRVEFSAPTRLWTIRTSRVLRSIEFALIWPGSALQGWMDQVVLVVEDPHRVNGLRQPSARPSPNSSRRPLS